MPATPQTTDDLTAIVRATERRLTAIEARTAPILGYGVRSPRFSSAANSVAYAFGGTITDMVITDIYTDVTRLYECHLHSDVAIDTAATQNLDMWVDGTQRERAWGAQVLAGSGGRHISAAWLWEPNTGLHTIAIATGAGSGNITFLAATTAGVRRRRQFWVVDIGPR